MKNNNQIITYNNEIINQNIFQVESDMEVIINDYFTQSLQLLVTNIRKVLVGRPAELNWFVYRASPKSIDNAINIISVTGQSVSIDIHISDKIEFPNYNYHPKPFRKSESFEIDVFDHVDAHHLVFWLASQLNLSASSYTKQILSFSF